MRKILGKTGSEFDNQNWIRNRSEMDPDKTGSEIDNLILQYLILDEVYSASFGSNFIRLFNFKKVTA